MKKLLLATISLFFAFSANAATIYVDANATGANNGSSWANAYNFLQDALADARSEPDINQIHVAQGMYTPDTTSAEPNGTSDRYASFALINGVALYGGFPSGGSALQDRDPNIYETILSGDIGTPIDANDNCYHVFCHTAGTNLDETAILDGFTITAGNGNGPWPHRNGGGMFNGNSSPTVTNCTFSGNSSATFGGGMSNWGSNSRPIVTGCTFTGNSAYYGGGMYNNDSSPTVTNCNFSGNSAGISGGGMCNSASNPTVTNCTFSGNSAGREGGGMRNLGSSPTVTNCILWGNTATSGGNEIYRYDSRGIAFISYCDIAGSGGSTTWDPNLGTDGGGNIDVDPCFVSPGYWDVNGTPADTNDDFWIDGDYRLLPQSLCINTGDPNYILDPNCPNDLDGNPRIVDGRIDMGAYEFPGMLQAKLFFVPRVLNTQSRRRTIVALLAMPEGILRSDINQSELLVFTPGNVTARRQYVFQWKKHGRPCTWVMAVFNKSDCMPHLSPGQNQVEVTGKLNDGRYFYGTDTIKIITPKPKPYPWLYRYLRR